MFSGRYIDDLFSIGNRKFIPALLNINHPHKYNITIGNHPPVYINGIYPCATADNPDGFTIELQHAVVGGSIDSMYNWFMDVAIYKHTHDDIACSQYFKTGIYNKRKFALHMLPAPAYTHIHSHCSHWSKLSTFYSQIIRATRICNNYNAFIAASAEVYRCMIRAGHDRFDMWAIIYKSLKFGARHYCMRITDVVDAFTAMVNDDKLDFVHAEMFQHSTPC
jgi:hypothetical protein